MKISNIYKIAALIAAVTTVCGEGVAVTISMNPGELMTTLPTLTLERELVLNGSVDIRDFNTLRELGEKDVKVLDMSGVTIKSFTSATPLHLGKSIFKADHLPAYSLFNAPYETIKLPAGTTAIEDGCMSGSKITSIEIPEGVTSIGSYAFYGCPNLTTVYLPTTLETIGRNAFANCPRLEYINIGETAVTRIPEECFAGDVALRNIDAPQVVYADSRAFSGSGVESVSLPQAGSLAAFALADMPNLMVITISPQTKFAEGTLMNCPSLMSINGVPENIPDLFVANCPNLPIEAIVGNASNIGRYSLANSGAAQITLGNNLTSINENAFRGAVNLGYIEADGITEMIPEADADAFAGLDPSAITLHVNDSLIDAWKAHPVWGEFNITSAGTTGVDTVASEATGGDIRVAVRGNQLVITASEPIVSGAIYDAGGTLLKSIGGGESPMSVDLTDIPSGVNLVSVRTATGFRGVKILF